MLRLAGVVYRKAGITFNSTAEDQGRRFGCVWITGAFTEMSPSSPRPRPIIQRTSRRRRTDTVRELGGAPRNPAPMNHLWVMIMNATPRHATPRHVTPRRATSRHAGLGDMTRCSTPRRHATPRREVVHPFRRSNIR